jgi:hypothetical protein
MNAETGKDSASLLSRLKFLGCAVLFALPFLGAGVYIMGISFGFLPSDPENFYAPHGIVGLAGALFTVGGLMVLLHGAFGTFGNAADAAQKNMLFRVLNNILGWAFCLIFGLIFTWGAFAPEEGFSGEISIGPVSILNGIGSLLGRGLFGIFGLLMLLVALLAPIYYPLAYIYRKIKALPMRNSGGQER